MFSFGQTMNCLHHEEAQIKLKGLKCTKEDDLFLKFQKPYKKRVFGCSSRKSKLGKCHNCGKLDIGLKGA
jgi:hypothetical protein